MAKRYTLTLQSGVTISSPNLRDLAGTVLSASTGALVIAFGESVASRTVSMVKEMLELPDDELEQAIGHAGTLEVIDD